MSKQLCDYGQDLARKIKLPSEFRLCKKPVEYQDYCLEHLPFELQKQREWENTPQETRQKYLDLLHEGKSIGEARDIVGISFEAAIEITNRSIGKYLYLERSAA